MKKAAVLFGWIMAVMMTVNSVWAQEAEENKAIQHALKELGINKAKIKPSPAPGLKMVVTDNGLLYITDDGKYVLQGTMYDISGKAPVNVNSSLLVKRLKKLEPTMIVYPAQNPQFTVTVFTDITCGYCRKLHQQIKEFNNLGITIRYLAFPRQGLASEAEKTMRAIWCSADRNKVFDAAMRGDEVVPVSCPINIAEHYQTGVQFGIQGTPAIVLSDGTMLPGYEEPQALLALLKEHKKMAGSQSENK